MIQSSLLRAYHSKEKPTMYNVTQLINNIPFSSAELARRAHVSPVVVKRAKDHQSIRRDSAIRILDVLSATYGVEYTLANTDITCA